VKNRLILTFDPLNDALLERLRTAGFVPDADSLPDVGLLVGSRVEGVDLSTIEGVLSVEDDVVVRVQS
jgi:hypothetical protein